MPIVVYEMKRVSRHHAVEWQYNLWAAYIDGQIDEIE